MTADVIKAPTVTKIIDGASPIDVSARRDAYCGEGWTRFDERDGV